MISSPAVAVGIDVGGTTIKMGLVDEDGCVLARRRIPYASMPAFDALADALASETKAMAQDAGRPARCIGVAAPGHAQAGDGLMVDGTANVPLLRNRSLAAALRERTGLPVATTNDGIAAALGELHHGAGRGLERFLVVTFGTGVGGGVVVAGRVVVGAEGEPPEIGAMVVDDSGNGPRTLEDFASAAGFADAYRRAGGQQRLRPEEIFAAAAAGDPAAGRAIEETCRRIAQAFGTLINALNLQACLVGGGIAEAGDALLAPLRRHLPDFTWPYLLARTRVERAATGADAGLLGAAAAALRSPTLG
ncbi:MAG TPA: ROK family protein [Caldimonas sp.]|jgi:glucokinase|nr:ROK family protein [Caldimonas sp.]HEX2541361.1 ROK family protein [Caldimonas sp.]